jgi:heme-degrading monooxygenase HmoA
MASVFTSGEWKAKPGREQEFISLWQKFASWSKENFPDAAGAKLLQTRQDPTSFVSLGQWEKEEVVPAWRGSDGFQERMAKIRDTLERMDFRSLDVVAEV